MNEQVQALEIKVAYLEKNLLDLDEVVRDLADAMSALARDLKEMREERVPHDHDIESNKPPHY